jgi:hypothetical protein
MKKTSNIIKKTLGEDFFDVLKKSDIYKINSKTVTSSEEIATGLKIVPRVVLSFLISNLSELKVGENKDFKIPFSEDCYMQISKKDHDSFSGYIYSKGKKINEFLNRSIPGIGLVLMTTFELYDVESIKENKSCKENFDAQKLQSIIDERLMLHSLISRVVDQKMAQRDAIEVFIKEKLSNAIYLENNKTKETTKAQKLKNFLEQQNKRKEEIQIEKTEYINCPDCGTSMYDGGKKMSLCICYGDDWGKEIKIKKNEFNIKMKFPKNIDTENIQMLLTNLKQINNRK